MRRYDIFNDDLCSDISLSIVLCARILAGIENDEETFELMLKRL